MRHTLLLVSFLSAVLLGNSASAEDYPTRNIRMIMPAGAGGTSDAYVRAVAHDIEGRLGKAIIVENIAGAGGMIGTRQLVKSDPDGYTIGWTSNAYLSHQFTSKEPQYRWPEDFVLVHKGTSTQVGMIVSAKSPFKTVAEVIAYAKGNPGKVKAANPGMFTHSFMASKQFQVLTGTSFNDVIYKTSADGLRSIVTGETDVLFCSTGLYTPVIDDKTARLLALLNDKRNATSPDIPTLKESGVNLAMSLFQGFAFPAGTPQAIVDRWYAEISKANQSEPVQRMIKNQSLILESAPREEMVWAVKQDIIDFEQAMKDAHLEAQ